MYRVSLKKLKDKKTVRLTTLMKLTMKTMICIYSRCCIVQRKALRVGGRIFLQDSICRHCRHHPQCLCLLSVFLCVSLSSSLSLSLSSTLSSSSSSVSSFSSCIQIWSKLEATYLVFLNDDLDDNGDDGDDGIVIFVCGPS